MTLTPAWSEEAQEAADADLMLLAGLDTTEYREWSNNAFFDYMTEATGVSFRLAQYNKDAEWARAKAGYQAGGDLPDVLFKAEISKAESLDMLESGVLVDLAPYLEEYCPNLWALLESHPEYKEAITLPDGRIPTLPYINDVPTQNAMWINTTFLENVKMEMPTTADELVKVLEAFRDRDPNQNAKSDEIPLGFLGAFDLKFLGHAFGLYCNDYHIFTDGDQVKFMPMEENFRLFITWCHDLYEAGLLDQDGFTTSDVMRRVTDEEADKRYGILIAPTVGNVLPASWALDYALMMPLVYDGTQVYRDFAGEVRTGAFALTTQCRDIPAALKWVDYLYSEAGGILLAVGKENVDYVVDADGTWRLSERANANSYFAVTTLVTSTSVTPGIAVNEFQTRYTGNELRKVTEDLRAFNALCVQPFPDYVLSDAQRDEILPLQMNIGYEVDMQIARWVLGEEEISDESFAAFEQKLQDLGLEQFLAFWQNILNNL